MKTAIIFSRVFLRMFLFTLLLLCTFHQAFGQAYIDDLKGQEKAEVMEVISKYVSDLERLSAGEEIDRELFFRLFDDKVSRIYDDNQDDPNKTNPIEVYLYSVSKGERVKYLNDLKDITVYRWDLIGDEKIPSGLYGVVKLDKLIGTKETTNVMIIQVETKKIIAVLPNYPAGFDGYLVRYNYQITSTPSDAKVYFDQMYIGNTPVSHSSFADTFSIVIKKDNYQKIKTDIQIVEGKLVYDYQLNEKKKVNIDMVFVEGGTFQMGCTVGNTCKHDEFPIHDVTLSDYYIGRYEVTQAQWIEIMDENNSVNQCLQCPVENVSLAEIEIYIYLLNIKYQENYRLPTEAEWEYAARGGKNSKHFNYSGSNDAQGCGWCDQNTEVTQPVGTRNCSNELGIYDMSGNVWEWCQDWYDPNYYQASPKKNPLGTKKLNPYRILRGGAYASYGWECRTSNRGGGQMHTLGGGYDGFRLVKPAED